MSADDKKAKRLEQSIKRKARKDRQREDAAWQQLMDNYWCDNNRDSDERWADALDRVDKYRDARGVLVMMVALGLGPDWVRERLTLLLNDKLPPLPPATRCRTTTKGWWRRTASCGKKCRRDRRAITRSC